MRTILVLLTILTLPSSPLLGQSMQSWVMASPSDGGYLGVTLKDVSPEDVAALKLREESGAILVKVLPGTPAEDADLQANDVVLTYAGQAVFSASQLSRLVSETPSGRTVEITISRDGKELVKTVEIGERRGPQYRYHTRPEKLGERLEDFEIEIPEFHIEPGDRSIFIMRSPARLGVSGETLTGQMAEYLGVPDKQGVLVMEVLEDTPAARAGLRAGDVIISCDGENISEIADLRTHLSEGEHELAIIRNKTRQTLTVEIPQRGAKRRERGSSIRL